MVGGMMKELAIILLIFVCQLALSFSIDLILKGNVKESLTDAGNPFHVMEFPEKVIWILLILKYIVSQGKEIFCEWRKKSERGATENK